MSDNWFKRIWHKMVPTPEQRFKAGYEFGREHFGAAVNEDELDYMRECLPLKSGDHFDEGVKAAFRDRIDRLIQLPSWAQAPLPIAEVQIGNSWPDALTKEPFSYADHMRNITIPLDADPIPTPAGYAEWVANLPVSDKHPSWAKDACVHVTEAGDVNLSFPYAVNVDRPAAFWDYVNRDHRGLPRVRIKGGRRVI